MKFTYSSGDRPLDGYTIKRGLGQGGFGEVYFAVSDGGREVALKQIEQVFDKHRGDNLVLNISHANLVTLFDIKAGDEDDSWIIMEYMTGNSLQQVITQSPEGLSLDDASAWFFAIASGVECLHASGIVHRDLKPGNIFITDGNVKVGDYGLSKFISCSQRGGHTRSVGTLHYMAPEIGNGIYGREIDVYALGIILFELLTGDVPFTGETDQEIMLKQLTAKPDLSGVPITFRKAIEKALQKDAADRYQSVVEMMRDVPQPNYDLVTEVQRPILPENLNQDVVQLPVAMDLTGHESVDAVHPVHQPPVVPTQVSPSYQPPIRRPHMQRWTNVAIQQMKLRNRSQILTELTTSMIKSLMAALLFGFILVSLSTGSAELSLAEHTPWYIWFVSVITLSSWTVLGISKVWETDLENHLTKRFLMFPVGALLGIATLGIAQFLKLDLMTLQAENSWFPWVIESWQAGKDWKIGAAPAPVYQHYIFFTGALFTVCRWWKLALPTRHFKMDLVSALMFSLVAWLLPVAPQPWMPIIAGFTVMTIQFSAPHLNQQQRNEFKRIARLG